MLVVPVSIGTLITVYVVMWLFGGWVNAWADATNAKLDRERAERDRQEKERHRLERLGDTLWILKQMLMPFDEIKRELQEGDFCEVGFPKYFIRGWGVECEPLSYQAVRENLNLIELAHRDPQPDNMRWCLTGMHYNDDDKLVCAHTGMPIVSFQEIAHAEREDALRVQ